MEGYKYSVNNFKNWPGFYIVEAIGFICKELNYVLKTFCGNHAPGCRINQIFEFGPNSTMRMSFKIYI